MNAVEYRPPEVTGRWKQRAFIAGLIAMAVSIAGGFVNPTQFFRSYLIGFLFWTGITLGSLAILMLQYLSGGGWGIMLRRPLEGATRTLPLVVLLFVPLAFGLRRIYSWTVPGTLPPHKALYLTIPFFLVRAATYFSVWLLLVWLMNKWSVEQDQGGSANSKRNLQRLAGPGLVIYGMVVTLAAVDWIMSLEPTWYSSIYGILIMGGQLVSAMALMILVVALLGRRAPMGGVYQSRHYHDMGTLLFAFVMLWAYFSVSQLIIIWSGNLPEEITWYVHRIGGAWRWVGLLLVIFHFALPLALLLSRDLKRHAAKLIWVAGLLIVARLVDVYWLTAPEFWPGGIHLHWMDVALPVGIGGLWLAYFTWQLQQRPLLPVGDAELQKALEHEAHRI